MNQLASFGGQAREAIPVLTERLQSTNACLKQRCILALWRITGATDSVRNALEAMVNGTDLEARMLGATALLQMNNEAQDSSAVSYVLP